MNITIRDILRDGAAWTDAEGREVEPEGRNVDAYFNCDLDAEHASRADALQAAHTSYLGDDLEGVGLRLPED